MSLHPDIERLALLGWRLYPSTRSRKGMFAGYIEAATSDLFTLTAWSRQYPRCNWSVIPQGSGVWALDVDVPSPDHAANGVAVLRELCARYGDLPGCPRGRSGGGGHLLVFRDAGHPIRSKTGTPGPGIDPRAGRVPFTVAPSIHRRGGHYRWVIAPWELTSPIAPNWLLRKLAPPPPPVSPTTRAAPTEGHAGRMLVRAVHRILDAQPGSRNATLNRVAFTVGGLVGAGVIEERRAIEALYRASRQAGLDNVESRATIRSGLQAGVRNPFRVGSDG